MWREMCTDARIGFMAAKMFRPWESVCYVHYKFSVCLGQSLRCLNAAGWSPFLKVWAVVAEELVCVLQCWGAVQFSEGPA